MKTTSLTKMMMMITMTRTTIPPDPDQIRMTQSQMATLQAMEEEEEEAKYLRKSVILPVQTQRNANNSEGRDKNQDTHTFAISFWPVPLSKILRDEIFLSFAGLFLQ